MALDVAPSFAVGRVVTAPSSPTAGTTLTLASGEGAKFSAPGNIIVHPPGAAPPAGIGEVMRFTGISTDQLTGLVRTQEGSTNRSVAVGDIVRQVPVTVTRVATISDADYTILPTDRVVRMDALTAARAFTLPDSAAAGAGTRIRVQDESGSCSVAVPINIARAGADGIQNGFATATVTLLAPYQAVDLISNGAGKWLASFPFAYNPRFTETPITSSATWSPSAAVTHPAFYATAQAVAVTTINNPAGTPFASQRLIVRVKDDGTARALTWSGSKWRAGAGLALPASTVAGQLMTLEFIYNSTDDKWDLTWARGTTKQATLVSDADYTVLPTDRVVRQTSASPAANRTWTLPLAASVPAGTIFWFVDAGNGLGTYTILLTRAGSDTITNGLITLWIYLVTKGQVLGLMSDGTSAWDIVGTAYPSIDGTLGAAAPVDNVVPSQKAVKTYVDTPRITTITSSATPTPTTDTDVFTVTALAAGATFAAPTGTAKEGKRLVIRIKDNATARTLAWNAIYRASSDLALPTTTILSKTLYLEFIYNATNTKWDLLRLLNNFT